MTRQRKVVLQPFKSLDFSLPGMTTRRRDVTCCAPINWIQVKSGKRFLPEEIFAEYFTRCLSENIS